jgi:hypothetical protein
VESVEGRRIRKVHVVRKRPAADTPNERTAEAEPAANDSDQPSRTALSDTA